MIIAQLQVTGDQKYTQKVNGFVSFDIHNDSPFNMGVSFNKDTTINGADFYTSPHSILTGIMPTGASKKSVGGAWFNGTVYIYTQTPVGGGAPNTTAQAPASSITIIGYAVGQTPAQVNTLNRMSNVPNSVSTSVAGTTLLQNDGNPVNTTVGEATFSGSSASNLFFDNQANFFLQQFVGGNLSKLFESVVGANPSIYFQGRKVSIDKLGDIIMGPSLTLGASSLIIGEDSSNNQGNVFGVDSNGNTFAQCHPTNNQFVLYDKNGVAILTVDTNRGLQLPTSAVSTNGTTSGTVTYYQPFTGTNFKVLLVFYNGYRNASATEQHPTIPVAFTQKAIVITAATPGITPYKTGSPLANSVRTLTALGTGTGGTTTLQGAIPQNAISFINQSFDALGHGTVEGGSFTDLMLIVGI